MDRREFLQVAIASTVSTVVGCSKQQAKSQSEEIQKVVTIGTSHSYRVEGMALVDAMPHMKKDDYNTCFLEASKDLQKTLMEDFERSKREGKTEVDLKKVARLLSIHGFGPEHKTEPLTKQFCRLMQTGYTAYLNGMNVHCVDASLPELEKLNKEMERLGKSFRISTASAALLKKLFQDRNDKMADEAAKILKANGGHAIGVLGSRHTGLKNAAHAEDFSFGDFLTTHSKGKMVVYPIDINLAKRGPNDFNEGRGSSHRGYLEGVSFAGEISDKRYNRLSRGQQKMYDDLLASVRPQNLEKFLVAFRNANQYLNNKRRELQNGQQRKGLQVLLPGEESPLGQSFMNARFGEQSCYM